MTETRRHALKMLGAVGATCAFPFAGDELYGQHAHPTSPALSSTTQPPAPAFFRPDEWRAVERLCDLIIPPTDTPGAAAAGVPAYIDLVISTNAGQQPLARAGLAWLDDAARRLGATSFAELPDAEAVALLQPLSDQNDRDDEARQRERFRAEGSGRLVYFVPTTDRDAARRGAAAVPSGGSIDHDDPALPARFFRLMKNLTADGYYTSRVGLLDELGYTGNTAMLTFPSCVPEG